MRKLHTATFALIFLLLSSTNLLAAVIDGTTTSGYGTFTDTNTNRSWLDLDAFAGLGFTIDNMITSVSSLGYTVANRADVEEVISSLPDPNSNWTQYKNILGFASYSSGDEIIWGAFADSTPTDGLPFGTAYAWSYKNTWDVFDNQAYGTSSNNRVGLWAYKTGSPVPEPATMLLFGLGLLGLAGVNRRK